MLEADQAADPPEVGLDHGERVAIALPPEAALDVRRDEFAMPPEQPPVCAEDEQCVVERAACLRALIDAYHDDRTRCPRRCADALGRGAGHGDRIRPQLGVAIEDMRRIRSLDRWRPVWIDRQPRLREDNQFRALPGRVGDQPLRFVKPGVEIEESRRRLHRRRDTLRE